jgi:hypothetical protein
VLLRVCSLGCVASWEESGIGGEGLEVVALPVWWVWSLDGLDVHMKLLQALSCFSKT